MSRSSAIAARSRRWRAARPRRQPSRCRFVFDRPLSWRQVGASRRGLAAHPVGRGARADRRRARLVEAIVSQRIARLWRQYRRRSALRHHRRPGAAGELSRNIVMSHAVGVGPPLETAAVRAIIAAAINNFAHGYSGVRLEVVERWLRAARRRTACRKCPRAARWGISRTWRIVALVLLGEGTCASGAASGVSGARGARQGAASSRCARGQGRTESGQRHALRHRV